MIPFPYQMGGAGLFTITPAAGPAATYWNPADKAAALTLSDGNRVAVGSGDWKLVRSVAGHATGKRYAEGVFLAGSGWDVIFGVANAAAPLLSNVGGDSNSVGLQGSLSVSSAVIGGSGGSGSSVQPAFGPNSFARIAVDLDEGHLWLGSQTAWAGGGDPAAGIGPTRLLSKGTTYFLACSLYGSASMRVRTGAADFGGAPPAGFLPWSP